MNVISGTLLQLSAHSSLLEAAELGALEKVSE